MPEFGVYAILGLADIQDDWLAKSTMLLGFFAGFRALGGLNSFLITKLKFPKLILPADGEQNGKVSSGTCLGND